MIDIDGIWIGFYNYDEGYTELTKFESIPFTATIQKGFNQFVGKIHEDQESGGIEDDILIKGEVSGNKIEFTKFYTMEHLIDENNESYSIESKNPTVVHYAGEYFGNENKFKGRWEIAALQEDEDGIYQSSNFSGSWEMWRDS